MAGIFTKNNGYVFDGTAVCAESNGIKLGIFCEMSAGQAKIAATYDSGTLGEFSAQITTPFSAGDVLTIAGIDYTFAAAEDVEAKEFAGATAADQAASLVKMVQVEGYAVSADIDALVFTQTVLNGTDTGPEYAANDVGDGVIAAIKELIAPVDMALITELGYRFRVVELTTLRGNPAIRADVVIVGSSKYYMAEQIDMENDNIGITEPVIALGEMVRMKLPQPGDQIVVNLPNLEGFSVGALVEITNGTGLLNVAQ